MPTYIAAYIVVHNSGLIRGILGTLPPQIFDLLTLPADCILKASNLCTVGVEGITSHYSTSVKHNWFAPIFVGGAVGSAGYLSLMRLNLFSPIWTLSSRLDVIEWDVYGPFVMSFLYLAFQGSNPQINNLVWSASRGFIGGPKTRYFNKEEAQALVIMVQTGVAFLKSTGFWDGRFPALSGSLVKTTRPTEARKLGGTSKKDL